MPYVSLRLSFLAGLPFRRGAVIVATLAAFSPALVHHEAAAKGWGCGGRCGVEARSDSTFMDPKINIRSRVSFFGSHYHRYTLRPGQCAVVPHFPNLPFFGRICGRIQMEEGNPNLAFCAYDDPIDFTDPPAVDGFGSYNKSPYAYKTSKEEVKRVKNVAHGVVMAIGTRIGKQLASLFALFKGDVEGFLVQRLDMPRQVIGSLFSNYNVVMIGRVKNWALVNGNKWKIMNAQNGGARYGFLSALPEGCAPVPLGPFPPPFHARAFFPLPFALMPVPFLDWASTYKEPKVKLVWCKDKLGQQIACPTKLDAQEAADKPEKGVTVTLSLKQTTDAADTGISYQGTAASSVPQAIPAALAWYRKNQGDPTKTGAGVPDNLKFSEKTNLTFEAEVSVADPRSICLFFRKNDVKNASKMFRMPVNNELFSKGNCVERGIYAQMPFIRKLAKDKELQCNDTTVPGVSLEFASTEENQRRAIKWDDEQTEKNSFYDAVSALKLDKGDQCFAEKGGMGGSTKVINGAQYTFMRSCVAYSSADGRDAPPPPTPATEAEKPGTATPPKTEETGEDDAGTDGVSCKAFSTSACLEGYEPPFMVIGDFNGHVLEDTPNVRVHYGAEATATQFDRLSAYRYLPPVCLEQSEDECTNYITGCYGWSTNRHTCDPNDNHISPLRYSFGDDKGKPRDLSASPCESVTQSCLNLKDNVKFDAFRYDSARYRPMSVPPEQMGLCQKVDPFSFFMTGDLRREGGRARYNTTSRRFLQTDAYKCPRGERMCERDPCQDVSCDFEGSFFSTYACHSEAEMDSKLTKDAQLERSEDGFAAGCEADLEKARTAFPKPDVKIPDGEPLFNKLSIPPQGFGRDRAIFAPAPKQCKYYLMQAWGGGARAGDRRTGGGGGYAEVILDASKLQAGTIKGDPGDTPADPADPAAPVTQAPGGFPAGAPKFTVIVGEGGYQFGRGLAGYRANYYRYNVPRTTAGALMEDTWRGNDPDPRYLKENPNLFKILAKPPGDGQDTMVFLNDKLLLVAEGGMTPTDFDRNSPSSIQEGVRPPGGRVFLNLAQGTGDAVVRAYVSEGGRGFKLDNMPRKNAPMDFDYFDKEGIVHVSNLGMEKNGAVWSIMTAKGGASGPFYTDVIGAIGERTSGNAMGCYSAFCEMAVARDDEGVRKYLTDIYRKKNLGPAVVKSPRELCMRDYLAVENTDGGATAAKPPVGAPPGDTPTDPAKAAAAGKPVAVYGYSLPPEAEKFSPETDPAGNDKIEPVRGYYKGARFNDAASDRYIYRDIVEGRPAYGAGGCGIDQFINGEGWPGAVIFHCIQDNDDDFKKIDDFKKVDFSDIVTKVNMEGKLMPPLSGALYSCAKMDVLLRRWDKDFSQWRYYTCALPDTLNGQFPEPLNVCKEVDAKNVVYEFKLQPDTDPNNPVGYVDTGAKTAGGASYNGGDKGHGVWRIYPNPPYCDGGVWRF